MAANKHNLLLLFDRPTEPVFLPKGKNNAKFDVPSNLLSDRYSGSPDIQERFGEEANERIPVSSNISIPNLKVPMSLGRDEQFTLLIPRHRRIAAHLVNIFLHLRSIDDLQTVAVYARDRLNPVLFNYALSVALLHRPDTKDLNLPLFSELFPEKFVDSKVFRRIREEISVVPEEQRVPIIIPKDYTASDLEPEHRLWYWREDMGINIHHWHWHLVYPFDAANEAIVNKDRRGELFYYMHQQIIARYNTERFTNQLARVKTFNDYRAPIAEAYFPKMDSLTASRAWPSRAANTSIRDLDRQLDQVKYDVADLTRWTDRFIEACHQGFVTDTSGNRIPLDARNGINILGNIMESSQLSVNRDYYGDLHNLGHMFIAYAHDPDHRHLETFQIMGDTAANMRDPVFYLWHGHIDNLFQEHKQRLPAYTQQELEYQNVRVTGFTVQPENGPANTFQTFWQQSDVDFSRGIDFVPRGNVYARFTHLQHSDFTYTINVTNNTGAQAMGTVRIFLAPRIDDRGTSMLFRDQRLLMMEMDRFVVALNPGQNRVPRRSTDSSLTIPFGRTFRDLDTNRPAAGTREEEDFNFCGCGWPQHMLVPKGTAGNGNTFDLFVMISNYQDDRIDQDLVGTCNDASSFCGVRDRLYPDRRAMGFPFDRLARQGVDRLQQFVLPNMFTTPVQIVHSERTVTRGSGTATRVGTGNAPARPNPGGNFGRPGAANTGRPAGRPGNRW